MIYVETGTHDPWGNLAHEEYFLKCGSPEPVLMLWQNRPTVVVGRYQNTLEEVDLEYVRQHGIEVIRRMTGGGAVYHDEGNLCYSFILRNISAKDADFSVFARPIIRALAQLGVTAQLSGRNDLTIDDKKFSGTAMALHGDSLLFHGTLLYDSDLSVLQHTLRPKELKLQSHAVQSVRSRVTNIRPYIENGAGIEQFKAALKQELFREFQFTEHPLTEEEERSGQQLIDKKYQSEAWTWGADPPCSTVLRKKYPGGLLELHLNLKGGKIEKCLIRGDFMTFRPVEPLEECLVGVPYEEVFLRQALNVADVPSIFQGITADDILDCLLG